MPSYSPVFSQGFIYYTPSTPNNAFDVPAGFTAVIREATYYDTAGAGYANIITQNSGAAPGITVMSLHAIGVNVTAFQSTRIVVPAGGIISLFEGALGSGPQVYVGGYLLRNALT